MPQQQDRELRRGQLQRRDAAQEVLEYPELGTLERVAEQFGQFAHLKRSAFRGAVGRFFADGPGRLGEIDRGGLGNSHRSKLAIPLESDSAWLDQ